MVKIRVFLGILLGMCVLLGNVNVLLAISDSASAATYGVDILNGGSTSGQPNEQVAFLFDVKNTGDTIDSYDLDVISVDTATGGDTSLWYSQISFTPSTISGLIAGVSATVQMQMDIPYPPDLSLIPPGAYELTVSATSKSDANFWDTQIFEVNVLKFYWADVQDTVSTMNVDIGDSVQYPITIINKGNDVDLLSCELQGDPTIPGSVNWGKLTHVDSGQMDMPTLTGIQLNTDESTQIILKISIPLRTDPAYPNIDPDVVTLTLIVKPSDGEGISDSVSVTSDINPIFDFDFTYFVDSVSVFPGQTAQFTLRIDNKGTDSDTYTYDIYQWDEDWSAFGFSFSPSTITISATTIEDVVFSINTPSDIPDSESKQHNISIRVHSTIGNMNIIRFCSVFLEPVYGVDVQSKGVTSKAVDIGSSATYEFTVTNLGNSQESFLFEVYDLDTSTSGSGDQSYWASPYLSTDLSTPINFLDLAFEETKTITIIVSIPNQNDPDFVVLSSPLQIGVDVISVQEPSIKDYYQCTTGLIPIYSFELSTTAPSNTKDGPPGTTLQFVLQVRNTGTDTDSYEFRVMSFDSLIFVVADPLDITNLDIESYGATLATVFILNDNSKAVEGTYPIEIHAHSIKEPDVGHSITLFVRIKRSALVDLTPSLQVGSGEPGDVIEYHLSVINMGNSEDSFSLFLSGDHKDWGEILNIQRNPISQVTLKTTDTPGYFSEIIVRVTIPATGETLGEESYPIVINAQSEFNDGAVDFAEISTTVESFVNLTLEYTGSGDPHLEYDPNFASPRFSFNVTNLGNIYESGIEIRVRNINPDWDYSPTILTEALDPGNITAFSLRFEIPSQETVDEYDLEIFAVSSVDPYIRSNSVYAKINIIKPDLSLDITEVAGLDDINFIKSKVGEQITVSANVHNLGIADAKDIEVQLYQYDQLVAVEAISYIPKTGFKHVNFSWQVPAEEVELRIIIVNQVELDLGNNEISPIYLDLRPNFLFEGDQIYFSNANPGPSESVKVSALILNSGGNANNVVVKFYEGTKLIGTDIIDIDYGEVGNAKVDWTASSDSGETVWIRTEIEYPEATAAQATRSMDINGHDTTKVEEAPVVLFTIIALVIVCLISLFGGYHLGIVSERRDSGDDYEDYDEEPPIEDAMMMVSTLPLPPPPPPPPPPEEVLEDEEDILNGDEDHDVDDYEDLDEIEELEELYKLAIEDLVKK